MNPLRKARWFASAVTLVAAFAWVIASNHCAIATMKGAIQMEHSCCHDETPAKQMPSTQCCEAFNVPIPDHAAAPLAHLHELKPAWVAAVEVIFAPQSAVTPVASDNGPPRAQGVLQVLLSRCLPAHAPPFVA